MITSEQIRAGRSLLRMTVAELANLSGVGVATIKRMEAFSGIPQVQTRTLDLICKALNAAGVEFIGTPEDRPGVRLNK